MHYGGYLAHRSALRCQAKPPYCSRQRRPQKTKECTNRTKKSSGQEPQDRVGKPAIRHIRPQSGAVLQTLSSTCVCSARPHGKKPLTEALCHRYWTKGLNEAGKEEKCIPTYTSVKKTQLHTICSSIFRTESGEANYEQHPTQQRFKRHCAATLPGAYSSRDWKRQNCRVNPTQS